MTRFLFPERIESSFNGYSVFVDFYEQTRPLSMEKIALDFRQTNWFEANLSAVLGSLLNYHLEKLNTFTFENLSTKVSNVLKRNHFLSNFGDLPINDYYKTTIQYRKFKTTEENYFKEYLDNELLSKEEMPGMSALLRKKINESIFEIFNNAAIHGDCKNVFTCGQYYPTNNRLDFTIVDLGKTIKTGVNNFLKKNLSGIECIVWAVEEGNTTKRRTIPGGLGLSLIRGFLKINGGMIQIISADGYWEQRINSVDKKALPKNFPGTIVNLEFNLIDKAQYFLASETIDESEIF